MPKLKQIAKITFWTLYIFILVIIGTRLFFEDQFQFFASLLTTHKEERTSAGILAIGYAFAPQTLNPTHFDNITRSRLNDVYEGLVRTDRNLKIEPGLAISWGLLNQTTWEFKIRQNVKFHNGKNLSLDDIVASIEYARSVKTSSLTNLLNSISEIVIIDDQTLHIKTAYPDPLLLNKLAVTFIFPKDYVDFENPIGTGPYYYKASNDKDIILEKFKDYWGDQPTYLSIFFKTLPSQDERLDALQKGKIDLLANVPPASVNSLDKEKIQIKSIPSLEVNFLMFNLQHSLFKNKKIRQAISKVIDRQEFVNLAAGFAHPISQFISTGVFGFNPNLHLLNYNPVEAKKEFKEQTANIFEKIVIIFDYPKGLDGLAEYLQVQFNELGIELKLNPLESNELQQKIKKGDSQLYYLGWKSELGDASDFLNAVVHSPAKDNFYGEFNGNHYSNQNLDQLMENSSKNLNAGERLETLQKIMKTIIEEDVIGIPLFETETIFAFNKKIKFEPRVDSYIYPSEIK